MRPVDGRGHFTGEKYRALPWRLLEVVSSKVNYRRRTTRLYRWRRPYSFLNIDEANRALMGQHHRRAFLSWFCQRRWWAGLWKPVARASHAVVWQRDSGKVASVRGPNLCPKIVISPKAREAQD